LIRQYRVLARQGPPLPPELALSYEMPPNLGEGI
jgi:hypothetical protein